MTPINQSKAWLDLEAHYAKIKNISLTHLFAEDPERASKLTLAFGDIRFDYSKNKLTTETLKLLLALTDTVNLKQKILQMFAGYPINFTEKRSALHTALRNPSQQNIVVDGLNIHNEINKTLTQMEQFIADIQAGNLRGFTNKKFDTIVNIGIGGSHLGPLLTTDALQGFKINNLVCHFIANIDRVHLDNITQQINPETTLFIISSKSFTTIETQTNAQTILNWFKEKTGQANWQNHFIAITAAKQKARDFGMLEQHIFSIWDWVGGRYSIWSAMGLPLALMIGMKNFREFLAGAAHVDQHFQTTPFARNIPVIMALLGIWYINFFNAPTHAIIPYSDYLNYLPNYIQQLDMESNGKNINEWGDAINYMTGPIVWGGQGCNGQHAFYQLLHQGQHCVPIDFILIDSQTNDHHHDMLIASAFSQAQALLQGKSYEKALQELGIATKEATVLAKHKIIEGNKPSNILFLKNMTPFNLGALLALYEHKIFVQGVIWQINSFDQWGVELGKQLMPEILDAIRTKR